MTGRKTAIIAVCGVAGAMAAIMTAVLCIKGNWQDAEPFDMEEDLFSDEEDEPDSEQDEQIHDVRAILNGKLSWSSFTETKCYDLASVMFEELAKLPDDMTDDMIGIKKRLPIILDELIKATDIGMFWRLFSVDECAKLPPWIYEDVRKRLLDIHIDDFEYPEVYLERKHIKK